MDQKQILQYYPFSSIISPSFWEKFTNLKLHKLKLNTDPVPIDGIYSRRFVEGIPSLFHIHCDDAVQSTPQSGEILTKGILKSTNTLEDFKKEDKAELIKENATKIWNAIVSGEAETNTSILSHFFIFVYGDLKKYHYYWWCAFPAFLYPLSVALCSSIETLQERVMDNNLISEIQRSLRETNVCLAFFTLVIEESNIQVLPLSSYYSTLKERKTNCKVWLSFSDPSNSPEHPGWVLRNLLTLSAVRWSDMRKHTIFAFRERISSQLSSVAESLVFDIEICDKDLGVIEMPSPLGWEKNERGKMGPRFCNMMRSMDPTRVAEAAVGLNLSLMKWRLEPNLDLTAIKNCRCLLFGAGTLGCNVARCLLGWGVQKITLIDGGKVSFSNPVRQSLYRFSDCQEEKMKAEAAVDCLKNIYPRVDAQGVCLLVPMPGHPVGPSQHQEVLESVKTLENLVECHDALFLLTDSRESRWLPTLMGASKNKIVLTAALAFDSYLVMRHGSHPLYEGEDIGCYFCNDVVAPGDSVSDRTLDQACTVSRPGISFMASGHITEMLIDVLQYSQRSIIEEEEEVSVPHSVRYYFGRMDQLITSTPSFKNCSACSSLVLEKYRENGTDFLINVFNSPSYLEEVSGLKKLHQESQVIDFSDFSEQSESE